LPPSSSRSRTSALAPVATPLHGSFTPALTVDVEEWFHNCWIPEYNDPRLRPPSLPRELDALLPRFGEELAPYGAKATLFVLGELARGVAPRLRELAAHGHEIACHGYQHFRANDLAPDLFLRQLVDAKALLEDLLGSPVYGYRAPEWSLRDPSNPRLRLVVEAGFRYDSSLVRALWAGSKANPDRPVELRWSDGAALVELPPMTWGGPLRLPAGGWCGRLAPPRWILAAVRERLREGGLPLLVVHPWELVDRPAPGLFTGLARLFHDAGRNGFRERFRLLLAGSRWQSVAQILARNLFERPGVEGAIANSDTEVGGHLDVASPAGAS
jgi:peptidoglycan/xylan/chitin deacetylase (PgdA/CDA1 family)